MNTETILRLNFCIHHSACSLWWTISLFTRWYTSCYVSAVRIIWIFQYIFSEITFFYCKNSYNRVLFYSYLILCIIFLHEAVISFKTSKPKNEPMKKSMAWVRALISRSGNPTEYHHFVYEKSSQKLAYKTIIHSIIIGIIEVPIDSATLWYITILVWMFLSIHTCQPLLYLASNQCSDSSLLPAVLIHRANFQIVASYIQHQPMIS